MRREGTDAETRGVQKKNTTQGNSLGEGGTIKRCKLGIKDEIAEKNTKIVNADGIGRKYGNALRVHYKRKERMAAGKSLIANDIHLCKA